MPLDLDTIRLARPENNLHYFRSVGSTMQEGARLAASGVRHGTVVIADEQTAGVGRLRRSWISERDAGIYCTIVLRLRLAPASLPIATLLLGLATAEAIQKTTQVSCDLRWPNDVLINGCKVAGILAQLVDSAILAGIGINVNHSELPSGLRTPATSIRMESGGKVQSREKILIGLLAAIDSFTAMLESAGPPAILRAFTAASSYALHRRVIVEDSGVRGVTAGLDENGFLLVRTESGITERVAAGGVRPEV